MCYMFTLNLLEMRHSEVICFQLFKFIFHLKISNINLDKIIHM
jgi:hypothetical protein